VSTTAALSSSTLLALIRQNGVIDEARLDAFLRTQPPSLATGEDARPLAEALVREKLLTQFQCNLLLSGKSRNLRIAGKYRLLERLGAGGMGLVYLCEHILMKRLVALKVLPTNLAGEAGNKERFLREAQAAAALKHPNIVQAFDVDAEGNVHYLVMEYVPGVNLDRLVSKIGPLDQVRAAHYIAQAADGLQHAAERGMVHRDIKPSNLLLDREGTVKILDMGLARFFDSRSQGITERYDKDAVIGTADYISPEQALDSKDVDIRADIYSLGCTFYFLLTGKAPFADANVTQKLLLHQLREPPPIKDARPDVDDALIDIIATMMAKVREDRFQTPDEVVEALAPWTAVPIDPPRPEEMPTSAWAPQSDRSNTPSSVSSRTAISSPPTRTLVRMGGTQVLVPIGDEEGEQPFSWKNLAFKLGAGALGIVVLVLAFTRPWETPEPPKKNLEPEKVVQQPAGNPPGKQAAPKAAPTPKNKPIDPGFVQLRLESGSPRPEVRPEGIRTLGSDLVFFTGNELGRNTDQERALLELLRKHRVGGNGAPGTKRESILPYAVAAVDRSAVPNTFIAVPNNSGLRAMARNGSDYFNGPELAKVNPESNVWLRGNLILPPGTTVVNAVLADFGDYAAAPGGSTLRIGSGAALFAGNMTTSRAVLGSGEQPLTVDFSGRLGFLTVASSQDFYSESGDREFVIRAKLTNTGTNPLALSGVGGNIVRLEPAENACSGLVVQGLPATAKEKPFRVSFTTDQQLGKPGGSVWVIDAQLAHTGTGAVEVDRRLYLSRPGGIAVMQREARLTWSGKIGGKKLTKSGQGTLVLTGKDNDYGDGTDVLEGTLFLNAEDATPVGKGGVTVARGATLAGTGRIEGTIVVGAGGVLSPGSEFGRTLHAANVLKLEEDSTVNFLLPNAAARPLAYTGKEEVKLNGVNLRFMLAPDYTPKRTDKCFLATSAKGWNGIFRGLQPNASVTSADGKWTAKISYSGNVSKNSTTGGRDLVLSDFTPKQD
jgi:autotransporter-associated beta strand protein